MTQHMMTSMKAISIALPLTLAIIPSLVVRYSGGLFSIPLDEVVDSMVLPEFDENAFNEQSNPVSVLLSLSVVSQVSSIVNLCNSRPSSRLT